MGQRLTLVSQDVFAFLLFSFSLILWTVCRILLSPNITFILPPSAFIFFFSYYWRLEGVTSFSFLLNNSLECFPAANRNNILLKKKCSRKPKNYKEIKDKFLLTKVKTREILLSKRSTSKKKKEA